MKSTFKVKSFVFPRGAFEEMKTHTCEECRLKSAPQSQRLSIEFDHWICRDGLAISCASGFIKSINKGLCRSSKAKGINSASSNEFLARQGMMSLKDLWINIHYSS